MECPIPRRSRMQSLIQEGRVKEIEFSTRHTVEQMANLLATNMPTLAGVNPTRYFGKAFQGFSFTVANICDIRKFSAKVPQRNTNRLFRIYMY